MATRDDGGNGAGKGSGTTTLPVVPAIAQAPQPSGLPDDPTPTATETPEALGFNLRFEAGRALLALDNKVVAPGVEIKRALFEVPDVAFPLDVSGGAQRFQQKRLTLRAIELSLSHAALFVPEKLKAAGFTLVRERSRAGAIELLVEVQGPSGPVPVRARGVIVPVGEAGAALVLHELIAFGTLPRPRLELCAALLDALALPGALPARAMLKRSEPFRAVLSRLLPVYGWKVPALGDTRVHEVVLGKGDITLRAWARELPDGWKAPRDTKRGPLEEAVALAVFADGLVDAGDDAARIALVDRLIDDKELPASVVPFAADVLRLDARRTGEADDLVATAAANHPGHTGLLAAFAELGAAAPLERASRLAALGRAAEAGDEPWVAARAFLAAAHAALATSDLPVAAKHAESAYLADPALPETGALFSDLLARSGDIARAVAVGRQALERAETPEQAEEFAVRLARLARQAEGPEAARVLLRRALRRADRIDALVTLVEIEVESGALERAAELLTRLLVLIETQGGDDARADVEQLAAHIAEARQDREAARMHLQKAQRLRPTDPHIAVRLARLLDDGRAVDRPLEALQTALEDPACPREPLLLASRLLLRRAGATDAERARTLLARIPAHERSGDVQRLDAEAEAALGRPGALARILDEEALSLAPVDAAQKRIEAGVLWLRAGDESAAADALMLAMSAAPAAVGDVLLRHAGLTLAQTIGMRVGDLAPPPLHAAATTLLAGGRTREAHALLADRADRASVELRAGIAAAAQDVPLEIAEIERLLALVDDEEPKAAMWLRRLGALHRQAGGAGPGAAADAYALAAARGSADLGQWLEAALESGDGARLAAVLRRNDVDVGHVPSSPLRDAIGALSTEGDGPVRLRVSAVLAARAERIDDVEAYLREARDLPASEAARVLAGAGEKHGKAVWVLEGAQILDRANDRAGALALLEAAGGPVASDAAVREQALAFALEGDDVDAIERTARRALAIEGLDASVRASAHERRLRRLTALEPARAPDAAAEWLDDQPTSVAALAVLVPSRLALGDTRSVVARLDDACKSGPIGAQVLELIGDAASAAHKRGNVDDEIRARELLLGGALEAARRSAELETLADLYAEVNRPERAVDVLEARVALGGDEAALAELFLRLAHLEEHQLKRPARAADALRGRLLHAPDDAGSSRRLQALLEATGDDEGLFGECMRRAQRLAPSAERNELLLKAGEAALRRHDSKAAIVVWLRALRNAPFSKEALQRLLDLGRVEKNRHLAVRARVAAARTLAEGKSAEAGAAAEIAAEAGAYLAGVMNRPRLALLCFRFAERNDKKPARHTRVIVDLLRAVGDADGALAALDRLLERAKERDRALLYETRADILEQLKKDTLSAAEARRDALRIDATQRTTARSLARHLRGIGDLRGAVDVDLAYALAALEGPALAEALARLAAEADDDIKDAAFAADLCARSLAIVPSLDVLRRHARLLEALGRAPEAVDALGAMLGDANRESLGVDELVALFRTKAHLEREDLGRLEEARRTLRRALDDGVIASHGAADQLIDELARVEEQLDEPAAAAALLLDVLAEHLGGTAALGSRAAILERAGVLLDDAREPERALALFEEASQIDALSRAGELRRARLAEQAGRYDLAEASLARLLTLSPDAEQRVALLGRIATAAERAGHLETAMSSWLDRQQRLPGDSETLRAIERLGLELSRLDESRAAAEALARLEVGDDAERGERALRLARDARDRLHDAAGALPWFAQARSLAPLAALRRESYLCAEAANDAAVALALLDEREGDGLDAGEILRRATLRLDAAGSPAEVFADVLRALGAGAAPTDARDLLGRLWHDAPDESWRQLLALAGSDGLAVDAVRAALPDSRIAGADTPSATVLAAADALPADAPLVREAARRERADGLALRASDRLIRLSHALSGAAVTSDEAAVVLDEAAHAALEGAGASALLARLEAIRPVLARNAQLRGRALVVLRDAEAWEPIATVLEDVLEDARAGQTSAEQRSTRLELVSVLRTGVGSEERAAPHLRALVDADEDDREAWGELFECLDALGDKAALAEALGRRSRRASGIEKRELVRRRASLLVQAGHGIDVLDELVAVRRDHPADPELFELERRIHESEGAPALGAFLYAELLRSPDARVARQLLELDPAAMDADARVLAHIVCAGAEEGAASQAALILDPRLSVARATAEAVSVVTRLSGDARNALLAGLARASGMLGSRGALGVLDALVDAGIVEAPRAFGVATVARRWRVFGPARAQADAEALRRAATTERDRSAALLVEVRLAARRSRGAALSGALADAGAVLSPATRSTLGTLADGGLAAEARAQLVSDAQRGQLALAASAAGVAWAVRLGDPRADLPTRSGPVLRLVAQRARAHRLTPDRLSARLALVPHFDARLDAAHAISELAAAATLARSLGRHSDAALALDRLFALRTPDAALLRDRADAARLASDEDAEQWAERAADALAGDGEGLAPQERSSEIVRLRRHVVDARLRRGSASLPDAIRALAAADPRDAALQADALGIAQAAGHFELADELMASAAEHSADAAARAEAIRRRAEHRLTTLKDAAGAFRLLATGAAPLDRDLHEEAYALAAREGLVEEIVEVVDDELARAGLLALLGRRREAIDLAVHLGTPAAWLLLAEVAAREGDDESEAAALERLSASGAADPSALALLVRLDVRCGRVEDAAARAADLVEKYGASADRVALLLDVAGGGAGAARTAVTLHALVSNGDVPPALFERALDVWEAAATVAGLSDDLRSARLQRCRLRDDDGLWGELLVMELPRVPPADAAQWLRPLLGRPAILRTLTDRGVVGVAEALASLVRSGDAIIVADALARMESTHLLPWALREVLGEALLAAGQTAAAAEALVRGAVEPAHRSVRAIRAAHAFMAAAQPDRAADALLAVPLDDVDEPLVELARVVVDASAERGALLAVRLATLTTEERDFDAALAAAERAPAAVANAIAGWRLKSAPLDDRAWRIVATRAAGAAQQLFAAHLALRRLGAWPDVLVDDVARLHRLRHGTLPPHMATAWVEAGRARSTIQRARSPERAVRVVAWTELATAATHDDVLAARLLARAGVPISEAPIEVRLAADPALAEPRARVAALVDVLTKDTDAAAGTRRDALLAHVAEVDARGFVGGRMRRAIGAERSALVQAIDDADCGGSVRLPDLLAALGRRPSASARTTAAALLAGRGREDLAAMVDARVSARSARSVSSERLEERADRAVAGGRPEEALGLLLLVTGIRGVDKQREIRVRELATEIARFDIAAQSYGRSAFAADDTAARARLLLERAELRLKKLDDAAGAVRDARFAAALTDDPAACRAWLAAAEQLAAPQEMSAALDALGARGLDPVERRDLAVRRAVLLLETLGEPEEALTHIETTIAAGLRTSRLLELKAAALARLGRHVDAAEEYAHASDDAVSEDRSRLRRAASASFAAAGLFDLAVDALCREGADDALLSEAEVLARAQAGPPALAQVLEAQLRRSADPHKKRLVSLERARILADQLGDRAAAIGALEQQALEDPADFGARLALAGWYQEDRRLLDAALAYESAAKLSDVPPEVAGGAARESAALLAALGDLNRAGPLAEQAIEAGAVDLKVLAVAEAWHRADGRFDRVDALLDREIALEPDPRKQAHLYMERYQLRRDWLGDSAGAKKALLRALELDPVHGAALDVMRSDARRDGSFGPLRAALFRAVDVAPEPALRVQLLKELATLDLDRFNDTKAAEATIDRAIDSAPTDAEALVFKARLLVKAGQVDGVSALLERAERAGVRDLPGILNVVRGDGLLISGDREGARRAFFEATKDKETAQRAWDRLIDLADGTPQVALVIEEARSATDDKRRIISLLKKEARVRAKGGDDEGAVRVLEELLAHEPGDADALKQVREAYTKKRKLTPLVPLMQGYAHAVEGAERAARLADLGVFLLDEIGNEAQARAAFEEALAEDAAQPRALLGLADVSWAARDDERALDLLDRIAPQDWPREQTELLYRRARCAYALGRDDAQERLRAVLRVDAKHQDALQMLVQISLLKNEDNAAEFALESLANAISPREDPVRLAQVYVDLASLRGRQDKRAEALAAAEHAFELDQTKLEVLECVASAREAADKHAEAAEAWRRIAALRTGAQRIEALERRANALVAAGRHVDAVDELIDLRRETGLSRFKERAEAVARQSGDAMALRRAGLAPAAPAEVSGIGAPPVTAPVNAPSGPTPSQAATAAPMTVPGVSHAPATMPPVMRPPATFAPATVPPATVPPATLPPATLPPATLPPATLPPATLPPAAVAAIPAEPTSTQTSTDSSRSASGNDRAIQRGFNALHMQVRANVEENDAKTALRLVAEAFAGGQGDDELMRLGEEAAQRGNEWPAFFAIVEAQLKAARDPPSVKALARRAAHIARDKLADPDRAAALLYQAHQADADDVEVRFELTEVYALIPRLATHAVTGVLQLLRRTPADERVFKLAADLAENQQQIERARALRRVQDVLAGRGISTDATRHAVLDERPPVRALDAESIASRIAPTGWGGPLQQLLTLCGSAIEQALYGDGVVPADAKALHEATPRGALALDRMERLLQGRPFRAFVAKVDRLTMIPSAVPTAVIPADVLGLGDAALLACVARAYGLVRMSHPIVEILRPGDEAALIDLLRGAFVAGGKEPRAAKLLGRLGEPERQAGRDLAAQVFSQPIDIGATLGVLSRGADRFALVASGDVVATLHASSLPSLMREPPQRARALLVGSPRSLELCGFAARDNTWLVRRQQGLAG